MTERTVGWTGVKPSPPPRTCWGLKKKKTRPSIVPHTSCSKFGSKKIKFLHAENDVALKLCCYQCTHPSSQEKRRITIQYLQLKNSNGCVTIKVTKLNSA